MDAKRQPCKGSSCKTEVIWARVASTGAKIPLDAKAPVYRKVGEESDGTPLVERDGNRLVSHFATCRDAASFSRSSK